MMWSHSNCFDIDVAFMWQATYEKGTKDEIEEFIYQLLDVSADGIVGR